MKRPEMLLYDEPTGALDNRSGIKVMAALDGVNDRFGTTILVIMHNSDIRRMAPRVIRFQDGRVLDVERNASRISAKEVQW